MHTADKQLLGLIIQSKADEGLIFADTPVYLSHTSLTNDLSAIGKIPFRFLMFNLPNSIQVGIIADIYTRLDLIFKALQNPIVSQTL